MSSSLLAGSSGPSDMTGFVRMSPENKGAYIVDVTRLFK